MRPVRVVAARPTRRLSFAGMPGVYQHCGENHLHRYTEEFAFRYTYRVTTGVNDDQRADKALSGIAGKRLTYRRIGRLAA